MDKSDFVKKKKSFCSAKQNKIKPNPTNKTKNRKQNTAKKIKRQATVQENVIAKHLSDKGLVIFRIYKGLSRLNKKTNNPFKNTQKV